MSDDAPDGASGPEKGLVAFRHADFRNYFLARSISRFAFEMQAATILWQVYDLTGNPFDLGLTGLAQILPFLFLFPLAGVAADRFPRARIMASTISGQVICAGALAIATFTDNISFPLIIVIIGIAGLLRSFQLPAEQAIIPLLIPKRAFANAVAWTAAGNQVARIAGPGLAGLMIILGERYVYASVVVLMGAALVFALLIRANTQVVSREPLSFANVFAGFRFILNRKLILGSISIDLFAVLLASATALLPIFAKDIIEVPADWPEDWKAAIYGTLRAMITVGAFCGSFLFTQFPIRAKAGSKLLIATAIYGGATVLFALSTNLWLSMAALFVLGFSDAISVFVRNNIVQLVTPDDMRGRVNAVNSVFIGASNQVGEFWSGITATLLGVVPAVVVGGAGTICVVALFARIFPSLRRLDSLDADDLVRRYQ